MKDHWREAFLTALENSGSVTEASKAAGIARKTAYQCKRTDPLFAKDWEESLERSADTLCDEARKRAFSGSDVLLMFLLKGLQPQRWRESRATIPPSELNALIEREFERLAKQKEMVN
jgi:hypothetical protein